MNLVRDTRDLPPSNSPRKRGENPRVVTERSLKKVSVAIKIQRKNSRSMGRDVLFLMERYFKPELVLEYCASPCFTM